MSKGEEKIRKRGKKRNASKKISEKKATNIYRT